MQKLKLLYISQQRKDVKHAASELQEQGLVIQAAISVEDALAMLANKPVDAILYDLQIPGTSVERLLRQVKTEHRELPVIILTAADAMPKALAAIRQGADDFVLKPLEANKVLLTVRKAVEKARLQGELRESEDALRRLLETVPDLVYSLDPEGRFLSVSPAAEGLLGYTPAELVGKNVFDFVHQEDREVLRQGFRKAMKSRDSTIRTIEFRMVSKSGKVRHFEVNRRLIYTNGKVVRQDGIARDVTERRRLEQELKDYSYELEKKVDERTEKLKDTARQLAALNTVSSRFTQIYDEEQLFEELPELLSRTLDFDRSSFLLERDGELSLRSFCMEKDTSEMVEDFLARVRSGKFSIPPHFHESLAHNKVIFVPDLNADERWPREVDKPLRTKAIVIAPIRAKNKPIGIIVGNMQHHEREMDLQDVERFEVFANMASLALDNIRAYQSLERTVLDRTESLNETNRKLTEKTKELEKKTYSLGRANVELLAVQEQLELKNLETQRLLKAVSESEERFRQLNENIKEVFWIIDLQSHKVLYVSQSYEDIFGRPCDALYEDPDDWLQAVHPDDLQVLRSRMSEMRRIQNEQEFRIRRHDGSVRWIQSRAFPVKNADGQVYRYCGVNQDITERVMARDALQRERNFVSAVLETAGALVIVLTTEGRIVRFNRACEITTGYAFDDVLDKYIWDLFIPPAETGKAREEFEELVKGNFPKYEENCWRTKSGDKRLIAWANTVLLDERHAVEFVVATGIDITDRKQAEKALQDSLTEVERANQHLRETQSQLVQSAKMASLGMLVAGIAHEINTPIGAVASMHDTLKRAVVKLKTALTADATEELASDSTIGRPLKIIEDANRIIDNGTERVITIVKRLRSFARLDEAELKTVDIHEGIEDTLTLIHHEIKHDIKVRKEFGDIPPIACLPGRLNQVYLNLLINARQAIADKGEIVIRTYRKGMKVYIEVADDGVGISDEKLAKVFDPGFTTKGVGVGTGLGLSICYQIIQDHRGDISVESRLGKGTKFVITIPTNLDKILDGSKIGSEELLDT